MTGSETRLRSSLRPGLRRGNKNVPKAARITRRDQGPQPAASGLHLAEWAAEFGGTAFQLFCGFSVVALLLAPLAAGTFLGPSDLRLALVGVAFGVLAAVVAVSPPGRRSGAHLNPAVTFAFWLRRHVHPHDLAGYVLAQFLGATTAAWLFDVVWGATADRMKDAATFAAVPVLEAVAVEAGLTAGLLFVVFVCVSHPTTARWTPAVVVPVLTGLIYAGAPLTGASMNPARTFGPYLVLGTFTSIWIYFVGPLLGAIVAWAAYRYLTPRHLETLTAKLFHDPNHRTTLRTELPARPARRDEQAPKHEIRWTR